MDCMCLAGRRWAGAWVWASLGTTIPPSVAIERGSTSSSTTRRVPQERSGDDGRVATGRVRRLLREDAIVAHERGHVQRRARDVGAPIER